MIKQSFKSVLLISIVLIIIYFIYTRNYNLNKHANVNNTEIFDFGYILNSKPCSVHHRILLIVTSYAGHVEVRSAHRRAYPIDLLESKGIKRVFLLAQIPQDDLTITQKALNNENERFGDIVQGDFVEAYRNLTHKHIMGLRWSFNHCPLTEFIMKVDDDIVLNLFGILEYLKKYKNDDKGNFLLGYKLTQMIPIRKHLNKWYVSHTEYRYSFYPPFLSGWMYITTPLTAAKLVSEALVTPYFWIDDVFVTGILAFHLQIKLKMFNKVFFKDSALVDCCINDMNHKNISCEYFVGSNGGNDNKIITFQEAVKRCVEVGCQPRRIDKQLAQNCIGFKDSSLQWQGEPSVHKLKL